MGSRADPAGPLVVAAHVRVAARLAGVGVGLPPPVAEERADGLARRPDAGPLAQGAELADLGAPIRLAAPALARVGEVFGELEARAGQAGGARRHGAQRPDRALELPAHRRADGGALLHAHRLDARARIELDDEGEPRGLGADVAP